MQNIWPGDQRTVHKQRWQAMGWVSQMSMILHKLMYVVNVPTNGGGVKNSKKSVNVVYEWSPGHN